MKRNSHPVKVVEVKDYKGLYANSHPFKVEVEGGGGGGETYSDFTGATDISAGDHGLVPAPKAGDNHKYLKGDGTWGTITIPQSGIPTTATFWGQSYDSVNNKVDGNIKLSTNASGVDYIRGGQNSMYLSFNHIGSNRILAVGTSFSSSDIEVSLGVSRSGNAWSAGTGIGLKAGPLGIILNDKQIHYVADPTDAQDAATKNYTDNLVISYASLNGASAPTTATEGKYVGQLYYDTTNDAMYYLSAITAQGTTPETYTYTWNTIGGGPTVVQTTGTSTTDVMSQDAVSKELYGMYGSSFYARYRVKLGYQAATSTASQITSMTALGAGTTATGSGSIAIGASAGVNAVVASGDQSIAIGYTNVTASKLNSIAFGNSAESAHANSISLGASSVTGRQYELSIGSGAATNGTRFIANVTDPTNPQDAATKNYCDSLAVVTFPNSTFDAIIGEI